jgi:DNA-directed RNA polymerase subunit RPC12/RpoP
MSIKFHCERCGKKIEASEAAAGKWGKCPGCHSRIFVPELEAEDGELTLAPVDETEEERQRRLMAETYELTRNILQERAVPEGPAGETTEGLSDEEVAETVIRYLRQMADGDLDGAQRTAEVIALHRAKAKEALDDISKCEFPDPELSDIPAQVLSGLIRNLRARVT